MAAATKTPVTTRRSRARSGRSAAVVAPDRVGDSLTRLAVEVEVLQAKLARGGWFSDDVDRLAVVVDEHR